MTEEDEIAQWVAKLNRLGQKMDEIAASMHPSGWDEALQPYRTAYLKLAKWMPKPKSADRQLAFPF